MKRTRSLPLLLALWCGALSLTHAAIQLPAIFTDHMVLQQGQPVPIWGTSDPDEDITVTMGAQQQQATADADGRWQVKLDPLTASIVPAELKVSGASGIATVKDVLVGEVWICSGQSNMQWTVKQAANAEQEIAAADFPQIRMFSLERTPAMTPQTDCKGTWTPTSPATAGEFSAVAYYFGRHLHRALKVPVGLINTSWGGTRVEAWTSRVALDERPCATEMLEDWEKLLNSWDPVIEESSFKARKEAWQAKVKAIQKANAALAAGAEKAPLPPAPRPPDDPTKTPHYPAVLFNGMIAPLIPYAVKGAIWYQGESNQRRAFQYQELLPTMINDWRSRWNSKFSFYIVQLASYGNRQPPTTEPGQDDTWVELQEAQYLTALTLPRCGLVVTNDIGEKDDIHPKNKQEVGRRLALWALAKDYDRDTTVFSGPLYKTSTIEGNTIRIDFDHVGGGLKTRDGGPLKHFQILGEGNAWHWAEARIEGDQVLVSSPGVVSPLGVRYAWAAWPEGANLINAEGLPASPFRTDDALPSTLGVVSPFKENLPAR